MNRVNIENKELNCVIKGTDGADNYVLKTDNEGKLITKIDQTGAIPTVMFAEGDESPYTNTVLKTTSGGELHVKLNEVSGTLTNAIPIKNESGQNINVNVSNPISGYATETTLSSLNGKITSDVDIEKPITESIINTKMWGYNPQHNDFHTLQVNSNGKLEVEAVILEQEGQPFLMSDTDTHTKLDTANTNLNNIETDIETTNTKLDTANTNLNNIETDIETTNTKLDTLTTAVNNLLTNTPKTLQQYRSEGKCYLGTWFISTTSSSNQCVYLNNPTSSTKTLYLYNISFCNAPTNNDLTTNSRVRLRTYTGPMTNIGVATATDYINLKRNSTIYSDINRFGTAPETFNSNTMYEFFGVSSKKSEYIINFDFQEEYIELPPGSCMTVALFTSEGIILDTQLRWIEVDN